MVGRFPRIIFGCFLLLLCQIDSVDCMNVVNASLSKQPDDLISQLANNAYAMFKNILNRLMPSAISGVPNEIQTFDNAVENGNQAGMNLAQWLPNLAGGKLQTCPQCLQFDPRILVDSWKLIYASDNFIKTRLNAMVKISVRADQGQTVGEDPNSDFLSISMQEMLTPQRLPVCVKWIIGNITSPDSTSYPMQYAFRSGTAFGSLRVGYGMVQPDTDGGSFTLLLNSGTYPTKLCLLATTSDRDVIPPPPTFVAPGSAPTSIPVTDFGVENPPTMRQLPTEAVPTISSSSTTTPRTSSSTFVDNNSPDSTGTDSSSTMTSSEISTTPFRFGEPITEGTLTSSTTASSTESGSTTTSSTTSSTISVITSDTTTPSTSPSTVSSTDSTSGKTSISSSVESSTMSTATSSTDSTDAFSLTGNISTTTEAESTTETGDNTSTGGDTTTLTSSGPTTTGTTASSTTTNTSNNETYDDYYESESTSTTANSNDDSNDVRKRMFQPIENARPFKYLILSEVNAISSCQNFLVFTTDDISYFEQYDNDVMQKMHLLSADTDANPLQYVGCPCGLDVY